MYGSRITSNRIPLLALGIDVVRDESQIVRSASLENKGYAVYVNKFGVPKGLLNMRSYPEQVPGVTPEKLIFKTIDLLQRSASSYYDMQHGFSILECARRTKDFEFLKTFGMYSSDLKRRLRLIILEAANLVKENKPEFRQLYADYLQGLGSSIKV
jgi:hypothetical protein